MTNEGQVTNLWSDCNAFAASQPRLWVFGNSATCSALCHEICVADSWTEHRWAMRWPINGWTRSPRWSRIMVRRLPPAQYTTHLLPRFSDRLGELTQHLDFSISLISTFHYLKCLAWNWAATFLQSYRIQLMDFCIVRISLELWISIAALNVVNL